MRLYIVRHADPDYPNNTLTPAGHLEAAAVARRLASHGLEHICASSLRRAQITAQYTADLLKLPVHVKEWLVEPDWFDFEADNNKGDGEKMPAWDIPGEQLRTDPRYLSWESWSSIPPLDNPKYQADYDNFCRQSDAFLAEHGYRRDGTLYRIESPHQDRIALFCHNGTALLWIARLLHIPIPLVWNGFWHAPSAVTTVIFEERSRDWAAPRCLSVGDLSHLYEARLPVQPRGIRGNFA
jgi:probable phosphoglycerate mutase